MQNGPRGQGYRGRGNRKSSVWINPSLLKNGGFPAASITDMATDASADLDQNHRYPAAIGASSGFPARTDSYSNPFLQSSNVSAPQVVDKSDTSKPATLESRTERFESFPENNKFMEVLCT